MRLLWSLSPQFLEVGRMSCCCPSCDARMIELVQSIDDLRRSLVIVLQESKLTRVEDSAVGDDSWYWNHG